MPSLRRNLASEFNGVEQDRLPSTPKPPIQRKPSPLVQTPISAADQSSEVSLDIPPILETSTPMPKRNNVVKSNPAQVLKLQKLPGESILMRPSTSGDATANPSPGKNKSVAFDPAVTSIKFENLSSSTNNTHTNDSNSIVEIDPPVDSRPSDSTYNQTLHQDFPGKFPKHAMIYPEDKSFASLALSVKQTDYLGSLAGMIMDLFTSSGEAKDDVGEDELEALVGNMTVTLNSLKPESVKANKTDEKANTAADDELATQYALHLEELVANYRYTTSLLADNIKHIIDDEQLRKDLVSIIAVLKDQEGVLRKLTHGLKPEDQRESDELINSLKSQMRDSVRLRARKIIEMANTSSGATNSRAKRARDAVFAELDKPGLTKGLLTALKQFENCDRTFLGEVQRSFVEQESRDQSTITGEQGGQNITDDELKTLREKAQQADKLQAENEEMSRLLKQVNSDKLQSEKTITDLRAKVTRLEKQLNEASTPLLNNKPLSTINNRPIESLEPSLTEFKGKRPVASSFLRKPKNTINDKENALPIRARSNNNVPTWMAEADSIETML